MGSFVWLWKRIRITCEKTTASTRTKLDTSWTLTINIYKYQFSCFFAIYGHSGWNKNSLHVLWERRISSTGRLSFFFVKCFEKFDSVLVPLCCCFGPPFSCFCRVFFYAITMAHVVQRTPNSFVHWQVPNVHNILLLFCTTLQPKPCSSLQHLPVLLGGWSWCDGSILAPFLLFVNTSAVASCLQKRVQPVTDADDTSVNKGDDVDSNDDDYDGNDMIEEIHYNTL